MCTKCNMFSQLNVIVTLYSVIVATFKGLPSGVFVRFVPPCPPSFVVTSVRDVLPVQIISSTLPKR